MFTEKKNESQVNEEIEVLKRRLKKHNIIKKGKMNMEIETRKKIVNDDIEIISQCLLED